MIHQDPVLSQVKLIAEPWDVGPGGYQVGNFPVALGASGTAATATSCATSGAARRSVGDFARRLHRLVRPLRATTAAVRPRRSTSSPPTTASRCATSSPTTHKHNEANGEDNRDGTDDNRSWNCGVEGPTDDPAVLALRARQQRNLLATLLLSQGVPMLLGGDELGRTQGGNNNAYCQDNEISWFDWEIGEDDDAARVHAPADRAAARASRVPADVSS